MFNGFTPRTVDFMWNIRLNNNRPWFEEHKEEYRQDFYNPMKTLGLEVYERITAEYPDYGFIHKLSRIYKDARRVRDGNPYKDSLWFSVEKPCNFEEGESTPTFWFDLNPESWSYGLGYYSAKAMTMAKLRARIERNPKKFEKLISILDNQEEFKLDGPEYARKKEAPTPKTAPWYNKKNFWLHHWQKNSDEIFSRDLADRIVNGYKFLMPVYDYISTIDADPVPK